MPEITHPKILKSLIYGAMRFASKLPISFGKIHFLSQVLSINHDFFISCLSEFSNKNNSSSELSSFYTAMQNMILTRSMNEDLRRKCIVGMLKVQRTIEFSSRFFLSLNDNSAFQKLLTENRSENLRDLAANAVFFALQNQSLEENENLTDFEKHCSDAIESGHDGISTHRTLALIKILQGKGKGTADALRNPEKPQFEFSQLPFLWHELALFSIYAGDEGEAGELLDSPKNKHGGPDLTNRLGAIAINLLLGRMDKAEKFASELDLDCQDPAQEFWPTNSPPYYIAFYQSVIFKHCADEKAIKRAEKMMDLTKIQLDESFRPLLDRISSSTNPEEHLMKLSNALSKALPQLG
jgi:hypothetical protein